MSWGQNKSRKRCVAASPSSLESPTSIIIMGYLRKRMNRRQHGMSGLGDLASTIESALGTGASIAEDPYLPEVLCHINQLQQINSGGQAGTCADTADNLPGGVGLINAVKPMRAYVWLQSNSPWGYIGLAAALIGLPMLIGYEIGKD